MRIIGIMLFYLISIEAIAQVEINPCDMEIYAGEGKCHIQVSQFDLTVLKNGEIKYANKTIKLALPQDVYVTKPVDATLVNNNILLAVEFSDAEYSSTLISSINSFTGKINWSTIFNPFNCSKFLIYNNELFVGGIGEVAKFNIKNGVMIWNIEKLYDSERGLFNSFLTPKILGKNVIFTEDEVSEKKYTGNASISINIHSGKVVN